MEVLRRSTAAEGLCSAGPKGDDYPLTGSARRSDRCRGLVGHAASARLGCMAVFGGARSGCVSAHERNQGYCAIVVTADGEAEEKRGLDLALQFPDRPFLPRALLLVKAALQRVVELQQLHDVGPAQKVRQRRTFWVGKVELARADDVAATESFAVAEAEVMAQVFDQGLAVGGAGLAALLKFHDVMPDLPKSPGPFIPPT